MHRSSGHCARSSLMIPAVLRAAGIAAALLAIAPGTLADSKEKKEQKATKAEPSANVAFTSSPLPLVLIDTGDHPIQDNKRVNARMKILGDAGLARNELHGTPATFSGNIGIGIRGQSSRACPKKQYAFETRVGPKGSPIDVKLMGMPAASEWILQGPCFDRSLLRNVLAFQLSNKMGRYAPRTRLVEAFIREKGKEDPAAHYRGVYVLMERIARGTGRVEIAAASDKDPSGGYLLKIDKGDDPHIVTKHGTKILFVDPDGPTPAEKRYVREYFDDLEAALERPSSDPEQGYGRYIDVGSFIDYFLLNELMKNVDAFRISTYMHKDRGGKLEMGPVWDFDRSSGNIASMGGNRPEGWYFSEKISGFEVPFWWERLLQDGGFRKLLEERWKELRQEILSTASITGLIDADAGRLKEPAERNFAIWPFLGSSEPPFNLDPKASPDYAGEIRELKDFLTARAAWMDGEIERMGQQGK